MSRWRETGALPTEQSSRIVLEYSFSWWKEDWVGRIMEMCRMQCVQASIHSLGVRERSLTIRIQWNGHERWSPCDSLEEDPPSTRQFGMKKDRMEAQFIFRYLEWGGMETTPRMLVHPLLSQIWFQSKQVWNGNERNGMLDVKPLYSNRNETVEWELSGPRSVCDVWDVREDRWELVLNKPLRTIGSDPVNFDWFGCLLYQHTGKCQFVWERITILSTTWYERSVNGSHAIGRYIRLFRDRCDDSSVHLRMCLPTRTHAVLAEQIQDWIFRNLLEERQGRRAPFSVYLCCLRGDGYLCVTVPIMLLYGPLSCNKQNQLGCCRLWMTSTRNPTMSA